MVSGAARAKEEPSNTRLTLGNYIADILLDERHHAPVFHWIVQRAGSPAIIFWGQEHTFEDALIAAQTYLDGAVRRDDIKQA